MNSRRHVGPPTFDNATALVEKPAPQPQPRSQSASHGSITHTPGIPWAAIRRAHPYAGCATLRAGLHHTHPRG